MLILPDAGCYNLINNCSDKMGDDKKQQKLTLRKNIICYFLAIAKAYDHIQQLQQQLVMHPYFNPILLFKKLSQGHTVLTHSNYIDYMSKNTNIGSHEEMKVYLRKYSLGEIIECSQFMSTLLPYTPDMLRSSSATIVWQVKSSPVLKKDLQRMFCHLLEIEVHQLVNISLFRNKISASWPQIRALIIKDLLSKLPPSISRLLSLQIADSMTVMVLRQWMELWVDVDEKDMLALARWIGGDTQSHLRRYYQKINIKNVECGCDNHMVQISLKRSTRSGQNSDISSLRSISVKPLSKKQQQMLQRKISYIRNHNKQSVQNGEGMGRSVSWSKHPVTKSSTADSNSKPNISGQDEANLQFQPYSNNQGKQQTKIQQISLFSQYVYYLLAGQNNLQHFRQMIHPFSSIALSILLKEVLSKKKNVTKVTKIIKFINKQIGLTSHARTNLEQTLGGLVIDNQIIINVFGIQDTIGTNKQPEVSDKLQHIRQQIAQILKSYCTTKSHLISISKQILRHQLLSSMFESIFCSASSTQPPSKTVTKQQLSSVVGALQIEHKQSDLNIIVRHFAGAYTETNAVINRDSFIRVFEMQAN